LKNGAGYEICNLGWYPHTGNDGVCDCGIPHRGTIQRCMAACKRDSFLPLREALFQQWGSLAPPVKAWWHSAAEQDRFVMSRGLVPMSLHDKLLEYVSPATFWKEYRSLLRTFHKVLNPLVHELNPHYTDYSLGQNRKPVTHSLIYEAVDHLIVQATAGDAEGHSGLEEGRLAEEDPSERHPVDPPHAQTATCLSTRPPWWQADGD